MEQRAASDQRVLAWGRLSKGKKESVVPIPFPGLDGKHLRHLRCGWKHSAVLTEDGDLYMWGRNLDGQLGAAPTGVRDRDLADELVPRPVRAISMVKALHGKKVVRVACGGLHTLAVTEDGGVYTWGSDGFGQLGHGNSRIRTHATDGDMNVSLPNVVQALRRVNVKLVACGGGHSMAIGSKGEVFEWGNKVGNARGATNGKPRRVSGLCAVYGDCGFKHTVAVTGKGDMYAWGNGFSGCLGLGDTADYFTPQLINSLAGIRIAKVSCGYHHTMAQTTGGHLYAWGSNSYGQLGLGHTENRHAPLKIEALRDEEVIDLSCGAFHSACVCDSGQVYTWGWNNKGQLGDGTMQDRLAPVRVDLRGGAPVASGGQMIACGWDFTILICGSRVASTSARQEQSSANPELHILDNHFSPHNSDDDEDGEEDESGDGSGADEMFAHDVTRTPEGDDAVPSTTSSPSASSLPPPSPTGSAGGDGGGGSSGGGTPSGGGGGGGGGGTMPPRRPHSDSKVGFVRSLFGSESTADKQRKRYEKELRRRQRKRALVKKELEEEALREREEEVVWIQHILPQFQAKRHSKKVVTMWRSGIPSALRGIVWPLAIGNALGITPELYEIFRDHARSKVIIPSALGKETTAENIEFDLPRTFPVLSFFQQEGPYYEQLREILEAFAFYRPDLGYVQGMSYLAGMLLMYMDSYTSFVCLANLLNTDHFSAFFKMNSGGIEGRYKVFEMMMADQLRGVYKHFQKLDITPQMYMMEWSMTLFTKTLPLHLCSRVWDWYLLDGEVTIPRVALGLLKLMSDKLCKANFEGCLKLLNNIPKDITAAQLFASINSVRVHAAHLDLFAKLHQDRLARQLPNVYEYTAPRLPM